MSDTPWRVILLPKAEKDLARLPLADQRRAKVAIDALGRGPDQGDTRKLQGERDAWRLRVGDWRVRFLTNTATHTIIITGKVPESPCLQAWDEVLPTGSQ